MRSERAANRKTGDAKLLQEALIALLSGEVSSDAIDAYDGERDGPCKIARTATHRPATDQESADVTAVPASFFRSSMRSATRRRNTLWMRPEVDRMAGRKA